MMTSVRPLPTLLIVLTIAASVSACSPKPAAAPGASADAWAVVNGHEIKRDEVEKAYRRTAQLNPNLSEDEALTAKLSLLNDLIIQDLLIAKASELKIELIPAELDKAYADGRKNIPDEQFQQELTRRNLAAADMKEGLRRDLLTQKVIEKEVVSKVVVSDPDINEFFAANKAQFNRTEDGFHLAQIVVTPVREQQQVNRSGNDAGTPQESAAKVQMLMERLKGGAPFGELAADFSEDPDSAQRGGDLGFVPVSAIQQAPSAMRDAVLKSQPGSVRVASNGDAHTIVLLIAKEAAGQRDPSMPEVKTAITTLLHGRREQLLRAAYLTQIRSDATVVNLMARKIVGSQGKMPSMALTAPGAK